MYYIKMIYIVSHRSHCIHRLGALAPLMDTDNWEWILLFLFYAFWSYLEFIMKLIPLYFTHSLYLNTKCGLLNRVVVLMLARYNRRPNRFKKRQIKTKLVSSAFLPHNHFLKEITIHVYDYVG